MAGKDARTGIVASGVISDDAPAGQTGDGHLDDKLIDASERVYRQRLVRRLLATWAFPGNLLLVVLCSVFVTSGSPAWLLGCAVVVTVASLAGSTVLCYRQHFRVRADEVARQRLRETRNKQLLREIDALNDDPLAVYKRYREELPPLIAEYRGEAETYRRMHHAFQGFIIAGSVAVSTMVALSVAVPTLQLVAVVLSLLVAVAAAMAGYLKFRERAVSLQLSADDIERQYRSVALRVGRYRRFTEEREVYEEFAHEVEALRAEQNRRQLDLQQRRSPGDLRWDA